MASNLFFKRKLLQKRYTFYYAKSLYQAEFKLRNLSWQSDIVEGFAEAKCKTLNIRLFLYVSAVFKLLPFTQNTLKLHHIKMQISQKDKYSMVFGPAFLALVNPKL